MSEILELNTAVDSRPLPLFDDAIDSSTGNDGGAGNGNFGVVHDGGVSISRQLMRWNAGIDL